MKVTGLLLLAVGANAWSPVQPNNKRNSKPLAEKNDESIATRRGFLERAAVMTVGVGSALSTQEIQAAQALPAVGAKAPTFELPNSRGDGSTSLNALTKSGKWTVLYFYPGAFTTGCTLEAKCFQRDIDQYRDLNAQIVGVSVDPPEKNAQFCSSTGLDFFMLSDIGGNVSKLYGSALSIPGFGSFSNRQTYLIDPQGNIRWVFTDVESRIPRHSTEVLEKLKELET